MRAAARDEPCDMSELDRVFEAYCASARDFRAAFQESDSQFNSVRFRLARPFIMKMAFGLLAMAHRRKGTWA
jgi:hypothetical protein